jgi:hypothetical protein
MTLNFTGKIRTGFGGENLVHPDRPGSKSPHGPPFHGHNLAPWKPRTATSGSCYDKWRDQVSWNYFRVPSPSGNSLRHRELDGADGFAFEEFGVGSEAEGF